MIELWHKMSDNEATTVKTTFYQTVSNLLYNLTRYEHYANLLQTVFDLVRTTQTKTFRMA